MSRPTPGSSCRSVRRRRPRARSSSARPRSRSRAGPPGWGWPMAERLVVAEGFTYSYPEATRPALRDFDLAIEPGSFTVLAGNSGSGKSTLIRALCGLVPHFHGGTAYGELAIGGARGGRNGPARAAGALRRGL